MTNRQRKPKPLTRAQIKEGLNTIPMDTLLLGVGAEAKLTPKQREFARLVALGESKAGAYRQSYNSKGKATTQRTKGYALTQRDDIKSTIQAFAEAQRFAESHTPAQLRAFVVQQLAAHASNEENPPAVRIKALELIGKHSGVDSFVNRSEVVHIKASGDIRERIAEKLKLIGASTTLEHNATQDDEQDADSLLAELTPSQSDSECDDPTAPTTPQNEGVAGANHAHIIPHNQTSPFSDPHNQSLSDSEFDVSDAVDAPDCGGALHAVDEFDSMYSSISDSKPSAERLAGDLSTDVVDNCED